MKVDLEPAFRRTDYVAAPLLDPPEVLPLPALTEDMEQAKKDLSEYGLCFLANALNPDETITGTRCTRCASSCRTSVGKVSTGRGARCPAGDLEHGKQGPGFLLTWCSEMRSMSSLDF